MDRTVRPISFWMKTSRHFSRRSMSAFQQRAHRRAADRTEAENGRGATAARRDCTRPTFTITPMPSDRSISHGDMPIILGPDGPSLGGFVCPAVVARDELWKTGQLKPGDKVRFVPVRRPSDPVAGPQIKGAANEAGSAIVGRNDEGPISWSIVVPATTICWSNTGRWSWTSRCACVCMFWRRLSAMQNCPA